MKSVLERFLSYVTVDTESKDDQDMVPSTEKQRNLGKIIVEELKEMGASNVRLAEHCYVYATIPSTMPANTKKEIPVLGFVAHLDTSPAISGKDVKARVVKAYDGNDILLNKEKDIVLSPEQFPALKENIGDDLVVTDGTTLLGADDKAGVAEIMTMAEYLLTHKEIPHGTIQIAFTPDEEVGRGVDFFDVEGFGADFGYTIDGGVLGEIEYENFNAAGAKVQIHGTSIHPGSAKGKMINAIILGMELQNMLPVFENPAYTENYEGFYHLDCFEGSVEHATMTYILRYHDRTKFEEKKAYFKRACDYLNQKYGDGTIIVDIKDSYYNMKEMVEPHMHLIENAKKAMEELGVIPKIQPIRGGTDGARLSFMGLPCPNLCTGGANFHGKYEYASVQSMEKTVEIILGIIKRYSE